MAARMYIWPRYALEVDGRCAQFTDLEGRIVARLYRSLGHFVRTDELIEAAYGDNPDGGPLSVNNSISHLTRHANSRLRSIGAEITSQHGLTGRRLIIGKRTRAFVFRPEDLWRMPAPQTASRGAWRYLSETDWRAHHVPQPP